MITEEKFLKALEELRKTSTKRNFSQTVDLIINLKEFDVRREAFSLFVQAPHKVKERKVAGFFEKKSNFIDTIIKDEFVRFKEKKDFKKLAESYDFFIANSKLMPSIATTFGRTLGPAGKMPSPQLGIIVDEDEKSIADIVKKINNTVKVKVKEPSIKIPVALESLKDSDIVGNLMTVYQKIIDTLPKKFDNVRNVKIKFTMSKPVGVEL